MNPSDNWDRLIRRLKRRTLACLLLLAPIPGLAAAAEPTPAPTPAPAVTVRSWTWAQTLIRPGQDRRPVFGARALAAFRAHDRVAVAGRLDASALGDGSQGSGYQTLEAYGSAYVRVAGPLSLAGIYGAAWPLQPEDPAPTYQQTLGGGVLLGDGTGGRYLFLGVGQHDAAGAGVRGLFAVQAPFRGPTSIVADGVLGKNAFVRAGLAIEVFK